MSQQADLVNHFKNLRVKHNLTLDETIDALVVKSAKAPWILFSARKNGTIPSVEFHKADLNQKLKTLGV